MKKSLLLTFVLLLCLGQVFAAPVDLATAKSIGEKFVRANMTSLRNFQNTKHVATISNDNGLACLYVFNIDDKGFVIVSADDRAKPILAYSDESTIDMNNLPSGLDYYLTHYQQQITFAVEENLEAEQEVVDEWNLVRQRGIVTENRLRKSVEPLIDLLWNQDNPYNLYCPTAAGGPGGRAYVGCAADAMAMVMKYWNYPAAGQGEHSYIPPGFPEQSVTFGEEYDWDNMPQCLYASSPQNQIHAIAILMYHCGVSINMGYGADGSGAYSTDVPEAMTSHFLYTNEMKLKYRETFSKTEWEDLLIANFDQGFPAFYAGFSEASGGHAFVCDGYTEDRYFHFNWGWTGAGNGNFAIDALNPIVYYQSMYFNDGQNAIFDMIPDYAFECMPQAPTIETQMNTAYSHKGFVTVTAPTLTVTEEEIGTIDKIVVKRNGVEVFSKENVAAGEVLTFEDEVDNFNAYSYDAYAVKNGVIGRFANTVMAYGPSCDWKLVSTTTSFQGWNGAYMRFVDSDGVVFKEITVDNSSPVNMSIQIPEGDFSVVWTDPKMPLSSLVLKLKNQNNETVYEFSGSTTGLNAGTIYEGNNTCENCQAPENLNGSYEFMNGECGALISWDKKGEPQNYKVYRSADGENYEEIAQLSSSENQYFDVTEAGEYYYQVTAYNSSCESMPAVTADVEVDYVMVNITAIQENSIDAKVFPNPTNGILNIHAEAMTNVTLYNMMGQKLIAQNIESDNLELDLSMFDNGIYMLKVVSRNGEMVQKIVLSE
ncbi:MAG: thiol protease/hemagglutinin PrtT [Bacteroidales bacterium]|nr:thiol protease/hemagglutinin PrtT [Bacteroidales bacterium]